MEILLVEDDISIAEILRYALEDIGSHKIYHETNGELGMNQLMARQFDLCLMDFRLPKRDGIEVATEYHNINGKTPIILLTANLNEISRPLPRTVVATIGKPFDPLKINEEILNILRDKCA